MAKEYLDKTGLAHFWDNIKGEIGNASDAQVDDWLDRHPEATTTVQDGAITTTKLANGAVTTAKLADGSVTDAKLAQSGGLLEEVDDLKSALNEISELIVNESQNLLNPEEAEIGLLNSSGIVVANESWKTSGFVACEHQDKLCIDNTLNENRETLYVCEYNANKEQVGSRTVLGMVSNKYYAVYAVSETNAKYIRFSINSSNDMSKIMVSNGETPIPFEKYGEVTLNDVVNNNPIYAKIDTDVLYANAKYGGGYDVCISFAKHGGNNLPDFYKMYMLGNENMSVSEIPETLPSPVLSMSTDWHGPYIVKAINNIDGDLPDSNHYTGGNHNYNNDATPGYTATAICDYLKYFINGQELTSFEGYCREVRIAWSNRVQATNTKKADGSGRYVLRENHEIVFDGHKWISKVDIIPLEDIDIKDYYGFQASGINTIYPNVRFVGGINRGVYTNAENHESGNKEVNGILVYGSDHKLEIDLNTTYDMGDRRFYDGTLGARTTSNKAYFYLIHNLNGALENNMYSAIADYKFTHS